MTGFASDCGLVFIGVPGLDCNTATGRKCTENKKYVNVLQQNNYSQLPLCLNAVPHTCLCLRNITDHICHMQLQNQH